VRKGGGRSVLAFLSSLVFSSWIVEAISTGCQGTREGGGRGQHACSDARVKPKGIEESYTTGRSSLYVLPILRGVWFM
jgi:hypothetical protein